MCHSRRPLDQCAVIIVVNGGVDRCLPARRGCRPGAGADGARGGSLVRMAVLCWLGLSYCSGAQDARVGLLSYCSGE